jgi:LPS export ABC transporter protein LptC
MKIISGKTIFASLVFLLIMSFVVNNFLNDNDYFRQKDEYKRNSENEQKIIGVEIRQQNKQGDKFLIIADTLEEIEAKEKKVILENSLTTIDQKGILTKISAGNAIITNDYNDYIFSNKVIITKKARKFTLITQTLTGTFKNGNYHTNDNVDIVSGNTVIEGKGIQIKKNGEYIKIKGKATLKMLLSQKNAY